MYFSKRLIDNTSISPASKVPRINHGCVVRNRDSGQPVEATLVVRANLVPAERASAPANLGRGYVRQGVRRETRTALLIRLFIAALVTYR